MSAGRFPDQDEFINIITGRNKPAGTAPVRETARVTGVSGGKAIIQFDGDKQPSRKIYPALKHYTPEAGDRVMLIDGVIIGGWHT